jgi:hypothetical protein
LTTRPLESKQTSTDLQDKTKKLILEDETDKLVAEMKSKTREQRLLNIKKLDNLDDKRLPKAAAEEPKKVNQDDSQVLNSLGVSSMDQVEYQVKVGQEIGPVFGDSAPGFIRSKRDTDIVQDYNTSGKF